MAHTLDINYLDYLEKKEGRAIFSLRKKVFSHGELALYFRVVKGLVFGFGMGNLLISRLKNPSLFYLVSVLFVSFILSLILINYERRLYRRKDLQKTMARLLLIFTICLIFSLLVFFYSDYKGFIIVLSLTMFFSSLAYSME